MTPSSVTRVSKSLLIGCFIKLSPKKARARGGRIGPDADELSIMPAILAESGHALVPYRLLAIFDGMVCPVHRNRHAQKIAGIKVGIVARVGIFALEQRVHKRRC